MESLKVGVLNDHPYERVILEYNRMARGLGNVSVSKSASDSNELLIVEKGMQRKERARF